MLYLNKTIIPCAGSAFILCGVLDCLFENIGLLNRESNHNRA